MPRRSSQGTRDLIFRNLGIHLRLQFDRATPKTRVKQYGEKRHFPCLLREAFRGCTPPVSGNGPERKQGRYRTFRLSFCCDRRARTRRGNVTWVILRGEWTEGTSGRNRSLKVTANQQFDSVKRGLFSQIAAIALHRGLGWLVELTCHLIANPTVQVLCLLLVWLPVGRFSHKLMLVNYFPNTV